VGARDTCSSSVLRHARIQRIGRDFSTAAACDRRQGAVWPVRWEQRLKLQVLLPKNTLFIGNVGLFSDLLLKQQYRGNTITGNYLIESHFFNILPFFVSFFQLSIHNLYLG